MTGHPLAGGPAVLLGHARACGGVALARLPRLLLLLARMTEAGVELRLERFLARMAGTLAPPPPPPGPLDPPLFILGHYRSGTTLLHKLVAADPRFASVRTFDLLLPSCPPPLRPPVQAFLQGLARALRVRQPFFHGSMVRLDDPNETEPLLLALASPWSAYWGYLFPSQGEALLNRFVRWPSQEIRQGWMAAYRAHLQRVSRRSGGRRLVVKDPPNTGRVATLLDLFPGARFVHVVRDPREVFLSMRQLWRDVILPRYALQPLGPQERDRLILGHYQVIMEEWEAQKGRIPPEDLAEIRYRDLRGDPVARTREVYEALRLPAFAGAEPAIRARWRQDEGFRPASRSADGELGEEAERALAPWRSHLGYAG